MRIQKCEEQKDLEYNEEVVLTFQEGDDLQNCQIVNPEEAKVIDPKLFPKFNKLSLTNNKGKVRRRGRKRRKIKRTASFG